MSIHPEILELIHDAIDGVASESEQIRLRDAIARDPAVREEFRRLQGLSDLLSRVEPEQPPAQLVPNVMREVHERRGSPRERFAGRILAFLPGGRATIRYAYAVAAGAAIGAMGLHLASGGSLFAPAIPERDAGATIGAPAGAGRLNLASAGIRGFATVRPSPSGTAFGLDLNATEPVEFILRFDPAKDGGHVDVVVVRDGAETDAGSLRLPRKK